MARTKKALVEIIGNESDLQKVLEIIVSENDWENIFSILASLAKKEAKSATVSSQESANDPNKLAEARYLNEIKSLVEDAAKCLEDVKREYASRCYHRKTIVGPKSRHGAYPVQPRS